MSYNQQLANRIRERMATLGNVIEKEMMGGLTFMYNDKMCVGIIKDEMMCRIDPEIENECLEKEGCRQMDFTKKPMKGYVMVDEFGMRTQHDFDHWIDLCIAFNAKAKQSKKRVKKA